MHATLLWMTKCVCVGLPPPPNARDEFCQHKVPTYLIISTYIHPHHMYKGCMHHPLPYLQGLIHSHKGCMHVLLQDKCGVQHTYTHIYD